MRNLMTLGFVFLVVAAVAPARAQVYDEATIETHLRGIYRYHGDRLFKWERPIRYVVAGFESEATVQLVRDQFTYLRDLTGLDVRDAQEAGEKGNFVLYFSGNYLDLAELHTLRSIFGREGQSDAEYRAMLEDMHRDGVAREITKRTDSAIAFYAMLADPTDWEIDHLPAHFLAIITSGLTQTVNSDMVQPTIWSTGGRLRPISKLPSFDEAYLRALYNPAILSGVPMDVAIPRMAAAITADLKN